MKAKQVVFILMVILLGVASNSYAQRRVIKTPRRTVVQGPRGTVVYRKKPVVRTVRRLPRRAVVIRYRNVPYYYHGGMFYVSRNGVYVRSVPPVGIRVAALPAGYVRVVVGPRVFFYAGGIFYILDEASREYAVADPPVGAVVSQLPSDAAEIEIDGKPFMEYNDIIYKQVTIEKTGYEVVGKLDE
ncbi:DUF6515 family protein [Prolixibacter sp. SD074]|uniref:DUF6515 family protein n=1 Tax=Prolixibacter sp. SD074 TaxID=2652391 RepID=UPI00127DE3E0|nr:DUF6515 family protein [Prolixibacter sp. SD074]GET28498.1 hypothetical protein SD074_07000 [Prolixibacter sp. SD074]